MLHSREAFFLCLEDKEGSPVWFLLLVEPPAWQSKLSFPKAELPKADFMGLYSSICNKLSLELT